MELEGFMYGNGYVYTCDQQSDVTESSIMTETPRKFGTDLTKTRLGNSAKAQSSSNKTFTSKSNAKVNSNTNSKKDTIRSNQTARNLELEGCFKQAESSSSKYFKITPKTSKAGPATPSSQIHDVTHASNRTSSSSKIRQREEYSVEFLPGSIGLKLEPVMKNGQKEYGCRVIDFSSDESQAKKSGKIKVGDVLVAINGKNVTSKPYLDIINMLKKRINPDGGRISFRNITKAQSVPSPSNKEVSTLSESGSTFQIKTPITPIQEVKELPVHETPPRDGNIFSPSFVRKMTMSTVKDKKVFSHPSFQADILTNVVKNMVPDSIQSEALSNTMSLPQRLSQVLIGTTSKKFDKTVEMKMELLTELSEARAALGMYQDNAKLLEKKIDALEKQNNAIQTQKDLIECTLKQKDVKLAAVSSQSEALTNATHELTEVNHRCQNLERENNQLRSQSEQIKIQYIGREKELNRQLMKIEADLREELSLSKQLQEKIDHLRSHIADKDKKIDTVTEELMRRTKAIDALQHASHINEQSLHEAISQNQEKESIIHQLRTSNAEGRSQVENLQKEVLQAQSEIILLKEQSRGVQNRELKLNEENNKTVSLLRESNKLIVDDLKSQLETSSQNHQLEIEKYRLELAKVTAQVDKLRKEREHLHEELSKLKALYADSIKEIDILRTKYEEELQRHKHDSVNEQDLQAKLLKLEQEAASYKHQYDVSQDHITSVTQNYKDELSSLTLQVESVSAELNAVKSNFAEQERALKQTTALVYLKQNELDDLRKKNESEKELSVRNLEGSISTLKSTFKSKIDRLESDLINCQDNASIREKDLLSQIASLRIDSDLRIQESEANYETKINELQRQLEEQAAQASNDLTKVEENYQRRLIDEISKEQEEARLKLEEMRVSFTEAVKVKDDFISALQNDSDLRIQESDANYESKINELQRQLEEQAAQASNDLTKVKADYQRRLMAEISKEREEARLKLEEMRVSFTESVEEKEEFISTLQKESDLRIQESEANYETKINELQRQLEEQAAQASNDLTKVEEDYQRRLMDEISKEQEESRLKLEEMRVSFTEAVKEKDDFISALQKESEETSLKLNEMRVSFTESVKVKDDFISTLQKESAFRIQECDANYETKINELQRQLEEQAAQASNDLTKVEEDYQRRLIDEISKEQEEARLKLEAMRVSFTEAVKEKDDFISTLKKESEETSLKLNEMRVSFTESVKEKEEFISSLQKDYEESHLKLEEMRVSLTEKDEFISSLQKEIEDKRDIIDTNNDELDRIKSEFQLLSTSSDKEREEFHENFIRIEKSFAASVKEQLDIINILETRIETNEMELDSKRKELVDLTKELKSVSDNFTSATASQNELISTLQNEVQCKENEYEALLAEKRQGEEHTAIYINFLHEVFLDLVETCKTFRVRIPEEFHTEVIEGLCLKVNISSLIRCINDTLKDINTNANVALDLASSREKAILRLERTVDAKDRDISSLKKDAEKLKSTTDDLKKRELMCNTMISDLKGRIAVLEDENKSIPALEEEIATLTTKLGESASNADDAQRKLTTLQSELEMIKNNLHETDQAASSSIDLIEKKEVELQNKDEIISCLRKDIEKNQFLIEELRIKYKTSSDLNQDMNDQIKDLEVEVELKSSEVDILKEDIERLQDEMNTLKKSSHEELHKLEEEKNHLNLQLESLETSCDAIKAKLKGQENVAAINDKECLRLINELDVKTQTIKSKNETISSMEVEIEIRESKLHEVQSQLDSMLKNSSILNNKVSEKEEMIQTLTSELEEIKEEHQKTLSANDTLSKEMMAIQNYSSVKIVALQNELLSVQSEINQISVERLELQEKLEKKCIECEGLVFMKERYDRAIEVQSDPTKISKEVTNVDLIQIDQQDEIKVEKEESPPTDLFSPNTNEVFSRLSCLNSDLIKMKKAVQNAITPTKKLEKLSETDERYDDAVLSLLRAELEEKNFVLSTMEVEIDKLLREICISKRELSEKEACIKDLNESLADHEIESKEMKKKMKTLQSYVSKLEETLMGELKRRRSVEKECAELQQETKDLRQRIRNIPTEPSQEKINKCDLKLAGSRAVATNPSQSVSKQMEIARQMACQLEETKAKISTLKNNLLKKGLLSEDDLKTLAAANSHFRTITGLHPNEELLSPSTGSMNWSISDDETN